MRVLQYQMNRVLLWVLLPLAAIIFLSGQQPKYDVKNINVQEAKAMVDAGALVIDVREQDKFNYRHIPNALSIPLTVLRSGLPASIPQATDKPIVVYCGDGVTIGPEATSILNKAGYQQAVNVGPGIQGWADAGYPVAHGQ